MKHHFRNIILIGMAGAGKSTIGPLLADRLGFGFLDTDHLIARRQGRPLQELLDSMGHKAFTRLEEETLQGIALRDHVIATGGSSVYCRAGMAHLRRIGVIVLLEAGPEVLRSRIPDLTQRGLVNPDGGSFAELYEQRLPLYLAYADLRIATTGLAPEQVCEAIESRLAAPGRP